MEPRCGVRRRAVAVGVVSPFVRRAVLSGGEIKVIQNGWGKGVQSRVMAASGRD